MKKYDYLKYDKDYIPYKKPLLLNLDQDMYKELQERCWRQKKTMSAVIRGLVIIYLEEHKKIITRKQLTI